MKGHDKKDLEVPLIERGTLAQTSTPTSQSMETPLSYEPDSLGFEDWCKVMGFSDALLAEMGVEKEALKNLYRRDTAASWLRIRSHWFSPRSLERMPERLWLAISMRPAWVSQALAKSTCWDPRDWVWVRGMAIPMVNPKGYALKLLMSNLWRGGVTGFKLTLHAILLISMGIQLQKVVEERPEDIWHTLYNGDSESWKRLIYDATGTSARLFWPLIFAPTIGLALFQMVMQTSRTLGRGKGRLVQLSAKLNQHFATPSVWFSWLRPQLPLDQPSFMLMAIADQLTFDGRPTLTPEYRQHAVHYLMTAVKQTRGVHRWIALKELASLTMGTHIDNLRHYPSETSRFTPATPLSHLIIRMTAIRTLEHFIQADPSSKQAWLYREWARYHGWMAGRKTPPMKSLAYGLVHVGLIAYFIYGFKVIIDAIQAYLDCPDKTGVSMTGIAAWSDDYTQPCFDAYLEFFRKIPGQPISFLLDIIPKVHFTQTTIELDLSYKGVNGSEIALIVRALADHGVRLSSLNLTGNTLARGEDYNTFMPVLSQLPGLQQFILDDVGLELEATPGANASATVTMAHWLPQLQDLRALSIRSEAMGLFSDQGVQALARALRLCQQIQELFLSAPLGWGRPSMGVIQLAHSVARLSRLRSLVLEGVTLFDSGLRAWAEQLPRMATLRRFSMTSLFNEASANATLDFIRSLSELPHLVSVDFSDSMIGAYLQDGLKGIIIKNALAAIANMTLALPHLIDLRLNNAYLGYKLAGADSMAFVRALEERARPLEVLEIAANPLSKPVADRLNKLLTRWHIPHVPVQLRDANETRVYLSDLPPTLTRLELYDGPQNDEALSALFQGVANTSITSLVIDGLRFHATERGFMGLANCTQLKEFTVNLQMGGVTMVFREATWFSMLEALTSLGALETLSLHGSWMFTFSDRPELVASTFARTLSQLPKLQEVTLVSLELSVSITATNILLDALTKLPRLRKLNLGGNFGYGHAESNASQALASRLTAFKQLSFLDVSHSLFGDLEGVTRQVADFLATVDRPFYLNGTRTRLGKYPDEAQSLMIAIANNPRVRASLEGAGFGTELWPSAAARLASETYDPYLQSACSNLQCFGIQPSLPDLGNSTRINFREEPSTRGSLSLISAPWALAIIPFLLGLLSLLAWVMRKPRNAGRQHESFSKQLPVAASELGALALPRVETERQVQAPCPATETPSC